MCLQVNLSQKKNSNDNLSQERVKKTYHKTESNKNLSQDRVKQKIYHTEERNKKKPQLKTKDGMVRIFVNNVQKKARR